MPVLIIHLLVSISFLFSPAPRLDAWKVLGPGGGGAQFRPTVSPHNSDRIVVSCDMTGAYLSNDGGESWRMFNLRGVVSFVVFDPLKPDVIYAKTIALWRTTDGGKTWNLLHPAPANVRAISMANDHASERILTKDGNQETVTDLAVDPSDSSRLYAVMSSPEKAVVRFSRDAGATWVEVGMLRDGGRKILVDPKSPVENRKLYVVGARSVDVFENGAWAHQEPSASIRGFADVATGFPSRGAKPIIYAITEQSETRAGRLYISKDGGATWQEATSRVGLTGGQTGGAPQFDSLATCATHAETAYLACSRVPSGDASAPLFSGLAKTTDGGDTWKLLERRSEETPNVDPRIPEDPAWFYSLYSGVWEDSPLTMGVDPKNPEICWATDYGNTVRSNDGGRTWVTRAFKTIGKGLVTTRGMDVTTCYGLHFDPFNPKRLFISYTDIGAFKSEDGGTSWGIATTGIPRNWRNTTYWIEFDPKVKGRGWAVFSRNHDLPRPKMWRNRTGLKYEGGVGITEDGGNSWKVSNSGLPQTAATHILLDPTSPVEARVLYVAGFGTGVFKSTDSGKTWAARNQGLPEKEPFAWRLARDSKGGLFLVVARRSEDARFGTEQDGALYRSTDGADHWEKVQLPPGVNGPNGLVIDPADPNRLYLAAWSRPEGEKAVGGGVFLSTDAGKTWRPVLAKDQHVYDITIDDRNPNLVYACGFESSVWRSEDRGENWTRIKGFNFKWGHRVIPDPQAPDMIYVTTFGGSLWHGPAKGDSKAREDIATPIVAYDRK